MFIVKIYENIIATPSYISKPALVTPCAPKPENVKEPFPEREATALKCEAGESNGAAKVKRLYSQISRIRRPLVAVFGTAGERSYPYRPHTGPPIKLVSIPKPQN